MDLNPLSVLNQAIKAVPAVKYALGIGGIFAVIAIIFAFKLDPRVAFIGAIGMILLMVMLVVFARLATTDSALYYPAMVLTWFTLLLFMATSTTLFTSVFFQKPVDLGFWIMGVSSTPPDIPMSDSGWVGGGSSPGKYCGDVLAGLQGKYPKWKVAIVNQHEDHNTEYNPFKHDIYRYQCWFKAS